MLVSKGGERSAAAATVATASAGAIGFHEKIGSSLEQARRELYAIGRELTGVLEPAGIGLVGEAQQLLERQCCRIAVIGQIKAGKSCFINALVRQPDLLPTDINPSTSAVTQLHFNQTSRTGGAAVFRFFSAGEWLRLAEGGGRLRDLTRRLVPGFEPGLLKQNISAVMSRAGAKLGPRYHDLLGQSHSYPTIDAKVLLKYVCAGEVGSPEETGLYSEITQAADLFLSDGPFAFPVTIIDTPGTNDPFLIRDEITRNTLDKADAYVVVLSAHQPLSEGDVSLLRILRGLHKERIAVFVNRIDELGDVESDTAEVVTYVRRRLAVEFPGFEIPIVAGSARLASEPEPARSGIPAARSSRSGMTEMSTVLNDLLASTHSAYVLRQIAKSYSELARATHAAVRHEVAGLRSAYQQARMTADRAEADMAHLRHEQQTFIETREIIERAARDFEAQMQEILRSDLEAQRQALVAIIDRHAADERDSLVALLLSHRAGPIWACDVTALRRALGAEFVEGFLRSQRRLAELSAKVADGLRRLIEALMPGAHAPSPPQSRLDMVATPSPSSLGRPLAVDLDVSWWTQLWRRTPTPDERGATLEMLIKEEFYPLIDDLLESHRQVLADYIATAAHWSFAVCANIVQALARRHDQLSIQLASVRGGMDGIADPLTLREKAERIEELERRRAVTESMADRLAATSRSIDSWF